MNWDDLRYFLATARTGQVTSAGQRLGVDQTTVGRRVGHLEEQLGAKLFNKSPRGYDLTVEGQRLMAYAEMIEASVLEAEDSFGGNDRAISGTVRIGAPEGIATYVLAHGAARLCQTHPKLEVQLVALPRSFSLSKREADFAIAVSRPTSGRLKVRKISDYQLHLYCSRDFLAERSEELQRDDISGVESIGYISDLIFDKELDYMSIISRESVPRLTSTSLNVQLEWAKAGYGICILPDFVAQRHPDLVALFPREIELNRSFWLLVHEDNARIERVRRSADMIAEDIATRLQIVKSRGPNL
jgi:DNA-binding transcriptional LysR family regulator